MDDSTVMLSAAKHLAAPRDRPFAEFTLSGANVLRVTGKVPISSSVVFFESPLSALGGCPSIQMKIFLHIAPQHPFSKPSILFLEWGMASLPVKALDSASGLVTDSDSASGLVTDSALL
jgi:hypothetical protein